MPGPPAFFVLPPRLEFVRSRGKAKVFPLPHCPFGSSMKVLVALLVGLSFVGSAGCVDTVVEPIAPETTPSSTSPIETTRPPASWAPREIHNQTYKYPEFGMGAQANETFEAPAETQSLQVRAQWLQNCPAFYAQNPRFYVQGPDGNTTQIRYNETSSPNATSFVCFRNDPPRILNVTGGEGTWRIWTAGEMRGSLQVAVTARPVPVVEDAPAK